VARTFTAAALSLWHPRPANGAAKLTKVEWDDLVKPFQYLPELQPLWYFSQDLYHLLDDSKTQRVARWRYTLLRHDPKYQGVRELVKALDLLAGPKLAKGMAFVQQPAGKQVRTNNHVERMNRRLRFAEKVVIAGGSGSGWCVGWCCCWTSVGGKRPKRPRPARARSGRGSAHHLRPAAGARGRRLERWGSPRSHRIELAGLCRRSH
jgi:hypothetical protein